MQKIVLEVGEGVGVMVGRRKVEMAEDKEREIGREMKTDGDRDSNSENYK